MSILPQIVTKYPESFHSRCVLCQSPVKYLYPSNPRIFRDLHGAFEEVRHFYLCTNVGCVNSQKPFNPSPHYALSHKHFTLAVWQYIGREAKLRDESASDIQARIKDEYGIDIAESTIRRCIDEIDVYLTGQIDQRTHDLVRGQGKVLICLDGQEPDEGEDALWLFVGAISNRVLKIAILPSADHQTLHHHIKEICTLFEVEVIGFISDKQNNITKMHDEFYPDLPHQYCQFHFLQNLWSHLESKDRHLQQALAGMINHLYIVTVSKTETREIPNVGTVNLRAYFQRIESDLRKLVKTRGKKFSQIPGIITWDKVQSYAKTIEEVCDMQDEDHRITKILRKTAQTMTEMLDETSGDKDDCVLLLAQFKEIQDALATEYGTQETHLAAIVPIFNRIWDWTRRKGDLHKKEELRAKLPKANGSRVEISQQWVRLFDSYKRGLFAYYNFPVKQRTNSQMEQKFGREKAALYARCKRKKVGDQIRIRGDFLLKQLYAGKDELKQHLAHLGSTFSREDILKGLQELEKRHIEEREGWQSNLGGKDALLELFGQKKRKKKGA